MPITVNTKSGLAIPLASNTSAMSIASRSRLVLASSQREPLADEARADPDAEQAAAALGAGGLEHRHPVVAVGVPDSGSRRW